MNQQAGSRRHLLPAVLGAAILVALVIVVALRQWLRREPAGPDGARASASTAGRGRKLVPYRREVSGDRTAAYREAERARGEMAPDPLENYGTVEGVPEDANPQVESVAEAARTGQHPERLSPFVAPKPFDRAAYEADPDSYLNTIEPGRVFQTAQPGPRVPRLRALSNRFVRLVQGETADLVVQVVPGAPVTFLSTDLGTFTNGLACTTVRANGQGVAKARFKATPGAIANCNVLAGCPLTSGQARFTVLIELPQR